MSALFCRTTLRTLIRSTYVRPGSRRSAVRTLSSTTGGEPQQSTTTEDSAPPPPEETWEDDMSQDFYDIIVTGGGMVGAAMALALGSDPCLMGRRILMLDGGPRRVLTQVPDRFSSRVCSLTPGTVQLLQDIGAWDHINKMRVRPYKRMQVWDACSDAMITFDRDDLNEDIAHIVENDVILSGLMQQLDAMRGLVDVMFDTRVKGYKLPSKAADGEDSPWARVILEDGRVLDTRLLIGADGPKSLLRQTANIRQLSWSYSQAGVVATLKLSEPTVNNVAWQRFLPTGPIAMLPLSETHSNLVWSTTTEDAESLLQMQAEEFVEAVNSAFWQDYKREAAVDSAVQTVQSILSTISPGGTSARQLPPSVSDVDEDSRAMFPLGLGHATQYVKHRMAIIGDAAHRVHPMAGQGVNLGFGDVSCLRQVVSEAEATGEDIGSVDRLLEFETKRQQAVIPMMAAIEGLHRLYSSDNPALVLLRSVGLQFTNAIKPLKNEIMGFASK
ncbi:putative ubiquinone biosynthesis monooxygenase [Branchiostoma belcheri]|nr:putative ubiquinone biosynthesis monooxygenase [Branchiostoma belcheri]